MSAAISSARCSAPLPREARRRRWPIRRFPAAANGREQPVGFRAIDWKPKIDWPFITWHLWSSLLRTTQTALVGLTELANGCELVIHGHGVEVLEKWSPWDHIVDDLSLTDADLAARLRDTVQDCIQALTAGYSHIALGVSGGLDSSIMAACIAGGQIPMTCFTLVTDDPDGDVRPYARALAERTGADLLEAVYEPGHVDFGRTVAAHLPRPLGKPWAARRQ